MLLGIVLHAAISYMPSRMPGLAWGVYEPQTNRLFDGLFWWIHGFRLPLFFLIAGFFTNLVYESRGPKELLSQRAKRILAPFLVGSLVILPISFYITACGWLVTGRCTLREILRVKFSPEIQEHLYGPAHLWFLEDLIVLTSALCAARWALGRSERESRDSAAPLNSPKAIEGPFRSAARPLAWAIPTGLLLCLDVSPVIVHHNSFVPSPMRLLYYGAFFVAGAWLYRRRQTLPAMTRHSNWHLVSSFMASGAMLWLLERDFAGQLTGTGRFALAASMSLAAWLSVFGFLGLFLRHFNSQTSAVRYLADASYWIYLVHLPIVELVQVDLYSLPIRPELKFGIVCSVTTLLGFLTYHTLVRYTFVGMTLNGRRERPTRTRSA
jgi:fucose 4-O-acetylase-like acetyltransferase